MRQTLAGMCVATCAAVASAITLWDQSNLVQYIGNPPLLTNQEIPPPDAFAGYSSYVLTDVDTGGDTWLVQDITVYFTNFNANYGGQSAWLGVLQQARLNVAPKAGSLPDNALDPRNGTLVNVTVAQVDINNVLALAITASGLSLPVSGEYWIGLTPVVPLQALGYYQEVPIPSPRIGGESAWRNPAGAFGSGTDWMTVAAGPAPDWWIDFDPAVTIHGIPEPGALLLLSAAVTGLRRRR